MKKFFLLISLLTFVVTYVNAQSLDNNNQKLVKVGDKVITVNEFSERYELSPLLNKLNLKNDLGAKYSLLYSIIGEKLWANEALENNIDTFKAVKGPIEIIEKLYVRDALYRKEILDKIEISNQEIIEGTKKYLVKLKLKFIVSKSESDINNKYYLLKGGYPFDSLYKELNPVSNEKEIEYGELEENVENEVYKLRDGSFSNPIFSNNKWYIFYCIGSSRQIFPDYQGKNNITEKVRKIIQERKSGILTAGFMKEHFKGIKASSDKSIIKKVSEEIYEIIKNKEASKDTNGYYFNLTFDEGINLEKSLGAFLNKAFININDKTFTLEKFVNDLNFFGFRIETNDLNSIEIKVNQRAKQFIEYEVLAEEGYKQGLNLKPEIVREVNTWRDNYLFQIYRNKFVYDKYTQIKDSLMNEGDLIGNINSVYKIIEIEFDNLDLSEALFENLGVMNFAELTEKYNENKNIKVSEKEIIQGLNDKENYGVILSEMSKEEVYGPLKTGNNYSIFKLIEITKDTTKINDKSIELIDRIAKNKAGELVKSYTAQFAKKYGIKINEELLGNLKTTTINSYIVRMFGFGGRIGAVPILPPFYNWFEEYKKLLDESL